MPTAPFLAPERDDAIKQGRAKSATNYYVLPGVTLISSATVALTAGRDYYGPFAASSPMVMDVIACEVTAGATGNLRMGIYATDEDWQPRGGPLLDTGDIAISVAVKTFTPSTPVFLPRGRYLTVLNMDTSSTFRLVRGSPPSSPIRDVLGASTLVSVLRNARAYAAFPTPGTAWDTGQNGSTPYEQYVVLRMLAP